MRFDTADVKKIVEYPCQWLYKIIGNDENEMRKAVAEIIQDGDCIIIPSNTSRTGKYHSMNVEVSVPDEEHRNVIYQAFKEDPRIKMVL